MAGLSDSPKSESRPTSKRSMEMELDVVGYHPKLNEITQYELSIDALSWSIREMR